MAVARRRRFKRLGGALAVAGVVVGVLAGLPDAARTIWSIGGLIATPFKPETAPRMRSEPERVVKLFADELRTRFHWDRPGPTFHEVSLDYFRDHFAQLDPRRPHPFGHLGAPAPIDQVSISDLAHRVPEFAGRPLWVEGRALDRTQVSVADGVTSWAYVLREPRVPQIALFCRVPESETAEQDLRPPPLAARAWRFRPGDRVTAEGVLIADGSARAFSGEDSVRVLYLACSSVGHSGSRSPPGA